MVKNKIIDSFFKRKACGEDEKNASTSSKIEKLHENPKIEENEKQLSKVPKVPSWLEYSPLKDIAYCLPCYFFSTKPSGRHS